MAPGEKSFFEQNHCIHKCHHYEFIDKSTRIVWYNDNKDIILRINVLSPKSWVNFWQSCGAIL